MFTQAPSTEAATEKNVEAFLNATAEFSDLRKNPLILTYLGTLYRLTKSVPRTRHQIYERLVTLMCEQWDASRGVASSRSHTRRPPLVAPAARNLALKMLEDNKHEVTESEFLRFTQQLIEERYGGVDAEQAAQDTLDFLRNRPWLLTNIRGRSDVQETYRFAHRTLMEYLAAAELVRTAGQPERLARELSSRVSDPEWCATGKLAIQVMDDISERGAARVISWLVHHSDTIEETERHQLIRFITDSLQNTELPEQIDSTIRGAVEYLDQKFGDRIISNRNSPSHPDASHWPISSAVPQSIADALTAIQGLLQRSRSNPELAFVAVTWVCATYEASARGCLPPRYGDIANPVDAVRAEKLITGKESQLLNEAFLARSSITHGRQSHTITYDAALRSARVVHDAISVLFDRAGGVGSATS
jgi:hypothetical protein